MVSSALSLFYLLKLLPKILFKVLTLGVCTYMHHVYCIRSCIIFGTDLKEFDTLKIVDFYNTKSDTKKGNTFKDDDFFNMI